MKKQKTFLTLVLLSLILNILSTNAIAINTTDEKIVYLTFDDGPGGKVTNNILDTLKKENVPATFFVIGCQIAGQENTISRMKNEGHSIGLHSFSHCREKLYQNKENFLKEMIQEQNILYDITGEKYNILRFPFGCNNNTYNLSEGMLNLLHENNFKIYDWTVDSGDGANCKSAPSLIAKKACNNKNNNSAIVLMHCTYINNNTAEALPKIIKFYKSEGYTFKAIDTNTPEVYKINKKV